MAASLSRYADSTARLDTTGIDFDAFRDRPLGAGALRCLRYMHDVESHTVCYLRDLLVTRAHKDPALTTFLTCWAYEEHWHGVAIGQVLAAHGEVAGDERNADTRQRQGWKDSVQPVAFVAASALMKDLGAVHMTWGAVNEWTTQAGYALLARKAGHPVLTELLRRIMKQEGRHIDVYSSQARERLEASTAARRATRWALRHLWSPVGAGVMPAEEVAYLLGYLFGGDDGRAMAARIDRRIDALPGLAGLDLVSGALAA